MSNRRRILTGVSAGGGAPGNEFYIAANGSGNGRRIDTPALFSAATINEALSGGKVVKMLGPAVTPAITADRRADEFPEDPYGHIIEVAGVIDFIKHPGNPSGPNGTFAGSRFAMAAPVDPEAITDVTGQTVGNTGLVLRAPVIITGITARRMGTVINFDTSEVANGTIVQDFVGTNFQRFNDTLQRVITPGVDRTTEVTLSNITWRRGIMDGYSKAALRAMHYCHDWLFEDITGNSWRQDKDSFARMIVFDFWSHHMIVRRCIGRNPTSTSTAYYNGDACVEWNDGNHHIYLEDCEGYGATDGGIDGKGFNNTVVRGIFGDNKRNIRCWADDTTYTGVKLYPPKNRGDTGNGRTFTFIAGSFSPSRVTDPLAGKKSSKFRGRGFFDAVEFFTIGQEAGTTLILTEPGAIGHYVNCVIDGAPLTTANMGTVSISALSKVIIYQGSKDPAVINCQITSPMTHTAPTDALFQLPLRASSASETINTQCYWELNRNSPYIDNGKATDDIELSSWTVHNPTLSMLMPAPGQVMSIDVTVFDAAKNPITAALNVTSVAVANTDAPAIAANGIIGSTKTDPTITKALPSVKDKDIIQVDVYSNAIGVNHPSIPGFTRDPAFDNVQNTTAKSWRFWKRSDGTETSITTSFWSNADDTGACSPVSGSTSHDLIVTIIRYAKETGTPYETVTAGNLVNMDQPPSTPVPYVSTSAHATINTGGNNRLLFAMWIGRNDGVDMDVHSSTPTWAINSSQWYEGAAGGDMTFTSVIKKAPTMGAYPGAKLTWSRTTRFAHMTSVCAYLPRAES